MDGWMDGWMGSCTHVSTLFVHSGLLLLEKKKRKEKQKEKRKEYHFSSLLIVCALPLIGTSKGRGATADLYRLQPIGK